MQDVNLGYEECDLRATVPDTLDFNTGSLTAHMPMPEDEC